MNILGISADFHDAAACLVQDGTIVAAAQEERFTRVKHDASLPRHAIAYCLRAGGVAPGGLDAVAFHEKPLTHFHRLLTTYLAIGPRGLRSFLRAVPVWLREKLWIPARIERCLGELGVHMPRALYFPQHHESHAASAFFPSPMPSAAVLTMDGVGEWATSTIAHGVGNSLSLLRQLRFPHSLGLLYSAFTYFTGFRVNSGEYKLMGLAPYGEPRYAARIRDLVDLREDGSFRLDMRYFDYLGGLTMTNERFARLFDGPPRAPEAPITRREMDLARSVQDVTEEIVLRMARSAVALTGERRLCLAGGVALNCVANGRLLREGVCDRIWVQPASGDAGGALGAALHVWYQVQRNERVVDGERDAMAGSFLGPGFDDDEIAAYLRGRGYPFEPLAGREERADRVARLLAEQKVVGLFLGRMEFGPRALGHRSILGDARSPEMQSVMNLKIKYRESFRPFAPSVLRERVADYFDLDEDSPYMLLVAPVTAARRRAPGDAAPAGEDLLARVREARSEIPAVTHVDHSARVQTVSAADDPDYHAVLEAFERLTGCPVIINTSFNVRGEPIVCTPEDAYRCFMRSEIDYLVLGGHLLDKARQPPPTETADWRSEFQLD